MDIYQLLKNDHRKVEAVFDKIEKSESPQERSELVGQLQELLLPHMQGEEQLVYPQLDSLEEGHDLHLEGNEEHHVAQVMLKELVTISTGDERFLAKCTVLKELIQHHVEEEEGEIFQQLKLKLSKDEAQALAKEMEAFKAKGQIQGGRLAA